MKKFMALLLVAGMTLSLTACGGSTDIAKTDQADGKDTFTAYGQKDCVTADRLGCKGYGVRSRYDRLYLEWIYDEWT